MAKIENDKKRKAKNTDLFVSGSLNNADLVPIVVASNLQVEWAPDITFKDGGALLFLLAEELHDRRRRRRTLSLFVSA